ncbi:MAG: STY0301 family protein [Aliidongia sp.]
MRAIRPAITLPLLLIAFPALATDLICPPDIKTMTAQLAVPVEGWSAHVEPAPNHLKGITFYEGPPSDGASLVPDDQRRGKSTSTMVWKFAALGPGSFWLRCRYANTTMTLERQLPASVAECTVDYSKSLSLDGEPAVERLVCK